MAKSGECSEHKWYLCKDCGLKFSFGAKSFVNRISKIRKALCITQAELATRLKVSISTIGAWESGRTPQHNECTLRLIEDMERQIAPKKTEAIKTLAIRILEIRKAASITQAELATRLKVSTKSVSAWESGRTLNPRKSSMRLIEDMEQLTANNNKFKLLNVKGGLQTKNNLL